MGGKMRGIGLGIGMSHKGTSAVVVPQAETTAWAAAVVGNSGTADAATQTIVDNFIIALKADAGLWSKVNNSNARLSLVCGDQLAAALVPILGGTGSATDTGNNLVGGDYSPTVGITGNAANKTVDADSTTLFGQTTADGCVLMASTKEVASSFAHMFWSDEPNKEEAYCGSAADLKTLLYSGSSWNDINLHPDTRRGIWATSTVSNAFQVYRNGGRRQATDITTFAAISAASEYRFLGRAGGSFESAGSLGGYFIGPGLTNAQMRTFCNAMQTALTALGRSFEKASEKRPLRAYGDSMTYGAGSTANANGWVKQYYTADPTRMGFNGGISGETSAQIKARLLLDAKIADDVVVIMAGTNDYQGGGAAVTSALADIAAMVAAVVATGNARYVVCTPVGSWADTVGTGDHTLLMTLCDGIAAAYPTNYVDTRQAVIDANNGTTDLPDVANDVTPTSLRSPGDDPHLNDLGYAAFTAAIKAFIDGKGW